jgi:hypothetical protein
MTLLHQKPWPATYTKLCFWMEWSAFMTCAESATKYCAGVRSYHLGKGMPWMEDWHDRQRLKRFKAGLLRRHGRKERAEVTIITVLSLLLFLPLLDLENSHNDRLFFAVTCALVYRGFRGGELLSPRTKERNRQLPLRAWKTGKEGGFLRLPFTKTSIDRPQHVFLPRLKKYKTCPAQALDDFVQKSTAHSGDRDEPLLLMENGKPLTIKIMLEWSRLKLQQSGQPPMAKLAATSWRKGMGTFADELDPQKLVDATKEVGRWKSNAYLPCLSAEGRDSHCLCSCQARHAATCPP